MEKISRLIPWAAWTTAILLAAYFFILPDQLNRGLDSTGYLALGEIIASGEMSERYDVLTARRTPAYPLLLNLVGATPDSPFTGVRYLHLALGLLTVLCSLVCLRKDFPAWLIAPLTIGCLVLFQDAFLFVMTEWLALQLLVLLALSTLNFLKTGSKLWILISVLIASFAALTRPVLALSISVPVLALVSRRELFRVLSIGALGVGFLPVLFWMGVNYRYLGAFSLSPMGGISSIGVAGIVGSLDVSATENQDLQKLIVGMNQAKVPEPGREREMILAPRSADQYLDTFFHPYHDNIFQVAGSVAEAQGWDRLYFNELSVEYFRLAIRSFPQNYFYYWVGGMRRFFELAIPCFLPLVLLAFYRKDDRDNPYRTLVMCFFLFLFVETAVCSAMQVLDTRYSKCDL